MNFNTIESQYTTQLKSILEPLYSNYNEFMLQYPDEPFTFDDWLYANLEKLGNALYDNIGEFFGDADSAMSDLNDE